MESFRFKFEAIRPVCESFSGHGYYVGSGIPTKKAANARLAYAVGAESELIALTDTTLFGSARTGLAICDDGLYWRNSGSDALRLAWQSFAGAQLQLRDNGDLFIGGDKFDTVGGLKGEVCLELLRALQHVVGDFRTPCEGCGIGLAWLDNQAKRYPGQGSIHQWLKPYHPSYRASFLWVCRSCIDRLNSEVDIVKARLGSGVAVTRHEHVRGMRTIRRFERIRHDATDCLDPGDLEDRLRLYAAQLGANACVEFFWQKQERRTPRTVEAGTSENGNPYYRTEYDIERWYTGFAVPANVAPFDQAGSVRSAAKSAQRR